eukprot:c5170_g1_i1.p1 GENE.c5170_g1_i1~~c5170_g1_i1.p1  ORF type:complete len:187 (-),score=53.00 c5170_g1_i1:60-620(-)
MSSEEELSIDAKWREVAAQWFYRDQLGFTSLPGKPDPTLSTYMARSLYYACFGDGVVSETEHNWILGFLASKGFSVALLEELKQRRSEGFTGSFVVGEKVVELMNNGHLKQAGRVLIYDAIRACSSDGFDPDERIVTVLVAKALGIDETEFAAIEQLVKDEEEMKVRRIRLLFPNGHPCLDEKYLQ